MYFCFVISYKIRNKNVKIHFFAAQTTAQKSKTMVFHRMLSVVFRSCRYIDTYSMVEQKLQIP